MTKQEIVIELKRVADEMIALSVQIKKHDWSYGTEIKEDAEAINCLGHQIKLEAERFL